MTIATKEVIKRPVLRYHGGKWKLAQWIIGQMPKHKIYVEPFGGAGSVLLQKPRSYSEVYNDLWGVVVNVFRVLRDPDQSKHLETLLRLTPYARAEFEETGDDALALVADPVEKARRTIFRSFAGFGSAATNATHATGFRANSNRSGTTPAHDWMNYPDHLAQFCRRLSGVVIENRPAIEVIQAHDTPQTLHYVDPPYLHATRNMQRGNAAYACEMTDVEHVELAQVLNSLQGMVMLSGYASSLYDELFTGWRRVERRAHADGARDRVEVLWLRNCAAPKSLFESLESN